MTAATSRVDAAPAIEVSETSRWYGNVVAVNDISFTVGPGITGLLGPNGAGKSTLLHMLAGFLRPSSGTVRILGAPAWQNPGLYQQVGIVQERESVYDGLTGYEFVRLSARLHHLPDVEAATRLAIDRVQMETAQGRKTGGYSKGMKQRIKIAAAIVHDPPVLLLDEPFNGTDPAQRLQMMDLLRRMAAEGRTILFSSHILEEVERLAERVLVIVSGRLAAAGDFRAIRRLMTDRPHTFAIVSSDNRALASALLADDSVTGAQIDGERITVRADDFERFTVHAPRIARSAGVTITEVDTLDESLESVFEYLVQR
ncbi:MAG: ABC transporter ATP-binding protein [Dehalococcoidia bacterium]|nr:ABC transporter ATP-binding protein [Dehalococcoidia bacterium]